MKVKKSVDRRMVREVFDPLAPETTAGGPRPRWQYMSRLLPRTADLDEFGDEGWELVSVIAQPADQAVYYFRRRIR